jgi:hypothetical protein
MSSKFEKIKTIMIGSIMTGLALVIADSWGGALKKTVILMLNRIRCGGFLLDNKPGEYKKCSEGASDSLLTLYINAFITTIILSLIALLIFGSMSFN